MRKLFYIVWRSWFYFVTATSLLVFSPIFLVTLIKQSWYATFFYFARIWALVILCFSGFIPILDKGCFKDKGQSFLFVANHTSMIDVMLMLYSVKNPFVFVGKKELVKMPVFGFFYRKTCILVDRSDIESRKAVFQQAQDKIKQGFSICIFPEGSVTYEDTLLAPFKSGAFRIAIEHQLPIVPLVFPDNKKRFSYTFFSGRPGIVRSIILDTVLVENFSSEDKGVLTKQVRQKIYNKLVTENAI